MNDEKMRLFYQSIIKDGLQPLPKFPQKVVYVVLNPANSQGRGGFRVLQQVISYRKSQISIERVINASTTTSQSDAILKVKTLNVKALRVSKNAIGRYFDSPQKAKKVVIVFENLNQQFVVDLEQRSTNVDYCLIESGSSGVEDAVCLDREVCSSKTSSVVWTDCTNKSLQGRVPATYGPARQVFASPFIVVMGTGKADPKLKDHTDAISAGGRYIANLHYAATDTRTVLYSDSEKDKFSESVFAYRKKNIILLGGPNINAVTKMYFDENIESHPILFDEFGFLLGNCKFHRPGYGLIALLPFRSKAKNKSHSLVLLIAGTDSNGLRSALRLAEPTIPPMMRSPYSNQIPDFVVVGPDTPAKGLGGVEALGFWGRNWNLEPASSYGIESCMYK
eukprot:g8265.t1